MSWCPKRMRTIEFSMVGSYTENPEKPRTVKIEGWALVQVWVLAQDNNYGM